ncbi:MAG: O-antigen ligase family protein [Gammaproteobacteria bacterium]|nr:O-antigen ligase family protein [Gammaproteobacteria bacterium]
MPRIAILIIVGLTGSLVAALVGGLKLKFIVAFVALLPMLVLFLSLRTSERVEKLLVIFLALSIPLNLAKGFLFRFHFGGAPAIMISASTLCVIALVLVWLYRYRVGIVRPLIVMQRRMIWASLIYMTAGVLSLWNADDRTLVVLEEIRLATLLVTMLVVMNFRTPELLRTFVFYLTVAVFMQGALATAQFLTHSPLGMQIFGAESELVSLDIGIKATRPTGTTGHPNVLGYFLASSLPLSLALLLVEKRMLLRFWYAATFLTTIAGLVVTLSRGAWITVPFSCAFTVWVLYRKRLFKLSGALAVSIVGAAMAVALSLAMPTIVKRFSHHDYQSAATRWPLNHGALALIREHPILGVGLNNFGEAFQRHDKTGNARKFMMPVIPEAAAVTSQAIDYVPYKQVVHNIILWVWAEVGTVGLLAFLWVFGSAFLTAQRAYPRADEWSRAVLVACSAGMMAHFIQAQIDPGFRVSVSVSMLFYSMFGLIGAISLQQRRAPARETIPSTTQYGENLVRRQALTT